MGSLQPICQIIAGPNGAGKTTFALQYLREFIPQLAFINADLIAAGLSPLDPSPRLRQASRLMLEEIDHCVKKRRSFAFETTLSGRGYLRLIEQLKCADWRVEMVYLALPSVETSILRVAERVAHGGHDVPLEDLRRRYPRSLNLLLNAYAIAVDEALCLLNTGERPIPVFQQRGPERVIMDPSEYQLLLEQSQ